MGNFIKTQTSFANGEVSPNFFANGDLHGLGYMKNFDIIPGGGLKRRAGLKKIAKITSGARIVPFSVSENENYILVMTNNVIKVFSGDTFIQDIFSPWSYSDLNLLQYAQRFGTMIFVHPNYKPRILSCTNGIFQISDFGFSSSDGGDNLDMPFTRFEDSENINITITHSGDDFHLTTNHDFWTQSNVGGHLSLLNKTWIVTSYVGARDVIATCNGVFTMPIDPISDWKEATFSPRRGWPCSITFHQNRLVFGGSKSWPGGVWMSHVGNHKNFNPGTGLDDEAIYFTLLSGMRQHICTIISSDNLQILTSEGEWAVSNKPLTPSSINIKMHTNIGCVASRYIPPQSMDGKTVFVSKNKQDIRELDLDELSENYSANNLCALSQHLIQDPIDISYNKKDKKLFVVMSGGNMAVMNYNPSLDISGWGRYTTQGEFCAVGVSGDNTFVITKRNSEYFLERFSDSDFVDVENYPYESRACGLPLMTAGHNAKFTRIKKIIARMYKAKTLFINNKRAIFPNEIYANDTDGFSGDISMNILGTICDMTECPWEISTSDALPLMVLSITLYGRYQI